MPGKIAMRSVGNIMISPRIFLVDNRMNLLEILYGNLGWVYIF
jgi:hypothetical protein